MNIKYISTIKDYKKLFNRFIRGIIRSKLITSEMCIDIYKESTHDCNTIDFIIHDNYFEVAFVCGTSDRMFKKLSKEYFNTLIQKYQILSTFKINLTEF